MKQLQKLYPMKRMVIDRAKRGQTLTGVKPVENKTPWSFQSASCVQNKVPPLHKL